MNRRQEGSFSMLLPQLMVLTLALGVAIVGFYLGL